MGPELLDLVDGLSPRRDVRSEQICDWVPETIDAARNLSRKLRGLAAANDESSSLSQASLEALQRSGLPLAVFSRDHGGRDLLTRQSARGLVAVLRLIGAGDLSMGRVFEGHVNAVALVERYGTDRQASALASAVRDGGLSAVWNAEGRQPLRGEQRGGLLRLSGQKILASGADFVTHPIVTPRTPDGVVMVIAGQVGSERVDLSAWTPLGMRSSATGTIELSGIEVPSAAQIGEPGDYLRQPVFSGGAWRFCAVHLGAAEQLLDLFRTHLRQRGRTEDAYQRQRIAVATAACVTARLWIMRAAELLAGEDEPADSIVAYANLTRMVTERACLDVVEAVQRGVGLGAFMRPDPIERIARDLVTYLRQPVPDAAMADAAAAVLASEVPTFDLWSA